MPFLPVFPLNLYITCYFTLSFYRGVKSMYNHIKSLREDRDLKQRELAEYLNCSQRTVSDYENGNTQIPPKVLIALSVFYDTSVDYLLDLTDVKEPYPKGGKERQRTQEKH